MEFTKEKSYDPRKEEKALVSWFLGSNVNNETRSSKRERKIINKPVSQKLLMDEKIYVAVKKDLVSKSVLVWAIQNTGGKEFCLVHVYKNLYRNSKEKAEKILDEYLDICMQMQVSVEKIHIEADSEEKGIIRFISEHSVKKFVMGAAADRHYSTEAIVGNTWEAERSKKEASLEVFKRKETEKETNEAIKRAKEWANAYFAELKRRDEVEMELKRTREAFEKMRIVSENRITESHMLVTNLQEKYNLAVGVLRRAKKERDELKTERNIAILEAETLKRRIHEEKMMMNSRSDVQLEAPRYFICPISQEVMEDPHVTADGITYEGEAIKSWLERGHETSPMTNKKLVDTKLVPNLALRSAIQEWLERGHETSPMTNT